MVESLRGLPYSQACEPVFKGVLEKPTHAILINHCKTGGISATILCTGHVNFTFYRIFRRVYLSRIYNKSIRLHCANRKFRDMVRCFSTIIDRLFLICIYGNYSSKICAWRSGRKAKFMFKHHHLKNPPCNQEFSTCSGKMKRISSWTRRKLMS